MRKTRQLVKNLDWIFLLLILIILAVNLLILSSASSNVVEGDPYHYVYRQLMWIIIGIFFDVDNHQDRLPYLFEALPLCIYIYEYIAICGAFYTGKERC